MADDDVVGESQVGSVRADQHVDFSVTAIGFQSSYVFVETVVSYFHSVDVEEIETAVQARAGVPGGAGKIAFHLVIAYQDIRTGFDRQPPPNPLLPNPVLLPRLLVNILSWIDTPGAWKT